MKYYKTTTFKFLVIIHWVILLKLFSVYFTYKMYCMHKTVANLELIEGIDKNTKTKIIVDWKRPFFSKNTFCIRGKGNACWSGHENHLKTTCRVAHVTYDKFLTLRSERESPKFCRRRTPQRSRATLVWRPNAVVRNARRRARVRQNSRGRTKTATKSKNSDVVSERLPSERVFFLSFPRHAEHPVGRLPAERR